VSSQASSDTIRELTIPRATADEMLKSKSHADYLESFDERSAHLHSFLVDLDHSLEYQVVALKDVYGPTASDRDISALVVSRESAAGGQASEQDAISLRKLAALAEPLAIYY
jgi:phosphopantetheine adenylyltransferase